MKHTMQLAAGTALAVVLIAASQTASADVFVTATIDKTKDITVTETITKTKTVDINVNAPLAPESAAEANAIVNVRNTNNIVEGFQGADQLELGPAAQSPNAQFGINISAELTDSVNDNTGVLGLNQDVGNMVNQGNVLAFSATGLPDDTSPTSLAHVQSEVDQVNDSNFSVHSDQLIPDGNGGYLPNKTATIQGSVNNNSGVIGVNQNAGNMNSQTNAVAMAVGFNALVALGESALGQVNSNNQAVEVETVKFGVIADSANANSGIVSVNQSTGNMNNQASAISFGALTSSVAITVPGT